MRGPVWVKVSGGGELCLKADNSCWKSGEVFAVMIFLSESLGVNALFTAAGRKDVAARVALRLRKSLRRHPRQNRVEPRRCEGKARLSQFRAHLDQVLARDHLTCRDHRHPSFGRAGRNLTSRTTIQFFARLTMPSPFPSIRSKAGRGVTSYGLSEHRPALPEPCKLQLGLTFSFVSLRE